MIGDRCSADFSVMGKLDKKILKRSGFNIHPCITPFVGLHLNGFLLLPCICRFSTCFQCVKESFINSMGCQFLKELVRWYAI